MNKIVYIQCESHFACDKIAMQSCNEWISQKLGKDERVNCYYLHEFIFCIQKILYNFLEAISLR